MNVGSLLRSATALAAVTADTVVFAPAALAAGALLGSTHDLVNRCYSEFARFALLGFDARVRTNGDGHLPRERRYVFVSNHQSHLDALAIIHALERHPVRFVAKQELGRIPLFGAALRATGNVMVNRGDTSRDVASLDAAQRELLEAISVLFFAEGSRSETGRVRPFKRGAAAFALKAGLPLVPIGVSGSFEIYPRGFQVRGGGTIGVAVGEPMEAEGRSLEDRGKLTEELEAAVAVQIGRARALRRR